MESSKKRIATTLIILIATALLIGGVVLVSQQNTSKESVNSTKPNNSAKGQTTSQETPTTNEGTSSYKAGNYNATGNYQSPGGGQQIKISLTINNDGTITDTSAQGDDKSSDSRFYQSSFIANYKDKIVGKKVDEVKLDHVGASSLTPGGFNNALEDIKNQAKA